MGQWQKCMVCGSDRSVVYRAVPPLFVYVKCLDCGFVYPPYTLNENERSYLGILSYYDYNAYLSLYHKNKQSADAMYKNEVRWIKKYVQSGNLLDIGSCYGFFAKIAMESGFLVSCVEILKEPAEYCLKEFYIPTHNCAFEDFDFEEEYFDIIFARHTFEHLGDPLKAIEKANRLCKKEGFIFIIVPNIDSLMSRLTQNEWLWLDPGEPNCHYSYKSLSLLLKKGGFEIVSASSCSGDLSLLPQHFRSILKIKLKFIYKMVGEKEIKLKWAMKFYSFLKPAIKILHYFKLGEELRVVARKKAEVRRKNE